MAEYIEREALIQSVTAHKAQAMIRADYEQKQMMGRNKSDWLSGFDYGMGKAIDIIANADVVEVRHGFWIPLGRDDNGMLIVGCTKCNRKQFGMPNYCPSCGAKMDGKGE